MRYITAYVDGRREGFAAYGTSSDGTQLFEISRNIAGDGTRKTATSVGLLAVCTTLDMVGRMSLGSNHGQYSMNVVTPNYAILDRVHNMRVTEWMGHRNCKWATNRGTAVSNERLWRRLFSILPATHEVMNAWGYTFDSLTARKCLDDAMMHRMSANSPLNAVTFTDPADMSGDLVRHGLGARANAAWSHATTARRSRRIATARTCCGSGTSCEMPR